MAHVRDWSFLGWVWRVNVDSRRQASVSWLRILLLIFFYIKEVSGRYLGKILSLNFWTLAPDIV